MGRAVKILHVIPGISPLFGGPSKVVFEMCRELQRHGFQTEIATTDTDKEGNIDMPLEQPVEVEGVTVWCFRCHLLRKYGFSLGLTKWLKGHMSEYDIIHIHAFFSYVTAVAAYYAKRCRIPYIIRPIGELDPWCLKRGLWKKSPFYRFFGWPLLLKAAAIHVTSQMELRGLVRLGLGQKCVVIPLGVEAASYESLVRFTSSNGTCQLLFLSRVDPKKGLPLLLRAVRQLKNQGIDAELTVAGYGKPFYMAEMEGLAHRLSIEEQVHFSGFVAGRDKRRCLAAADVFVLPSYHENFGVAVTEAMAAGLPVIISDQVALAQEVEESRAGRVIPAGSVDALAEAIEEIATDVTKQKDMGYRARKLVEQRFTWSRAGKQLADLYRAVI
ncbi:MAG: glycosyltransferase [Candidatus Binatia bacterium]